MIKDTPLTLLQDCTRVTLIGDNGVIFERYNLDKVEISFQDNGRTLKVFVKGDAV